MEEDDFIYGQKKLCVKVTDGVLTLKNNSVFDSRFTLQARRTGIHYDIDNDCLILAMLAVWLCLLLNQ